MKPVRLTLHELAREAILARPNGYPKVLASILAEPTFPVQRINLQASGRGYTLLMHAVTTGNAELVKLLIEHGADPNVGETYKGFQAVDMIRLSQEAGRQGDFHEIGQLLVSAGADAMKLPENAFFR